MPLGAALASIGTLLLALAGCPGPTGPDRGGEGEPPGEQGAVIAADEIQSPDVGRMAAGPAFTHSGPSMSFFDPETHPGRLLWLRADRGVAGAAAAHWDGESHTRLRSGSGTAGLNVGNQDMMFAAWVRVNTLPPAAGYNLGGTHLAGKWGSTATSSSLREWLLCLNAAGGAANQFCFLGRGADSNPARSAIPGGIEAGRWYFVAAWIDATSGAKRLNLSVDGQPPVTVPYSGTPADSTTAFTLGASINHSGNPAISMAGAAFFKAPPGTLAAHAGAMVATLRDGGKGSDLSNATAGQLHAWGLVAHWPLDELSGVRRNRVGGLNHRQNDLEDDSGVGATPGPTLLPAEHDGLVARWSDHDGGRVFVASGAARWRRSSPRIWAADASAGLEHAGTVLAGRPQWTATFVSSLRLDRAGLLYGESGGADAIAIRLDADGVPELAVTASGVEHVARASDSLHGLRGVSAASGADAPFDATARAECTLAVGAGHPFAVGDLVAVRGLGAPYDGEQMLTRADPGSVAYIAEGVPAPAPADLSAAEVVGLGLIRLSPGMSADHGNAREAIRSVLSVRRDGQQVAFFRDGSPIGTATLGTASTGPASGTTRVLGGDAPDGAIEHVYLTDSAEPDAAILARAQRLAVRASRTSGPGPLAVQFDATRFPGVDRMAAQDYHFCWLFARKGQRVPHDAWAGSWSGQSYARPTGPFVSQVFEEEGEYEAHLAVVTPHHGRDGQRGAQQVLFAGKVADIEVTPWPADATVYVSSTHPNRDNAGPGTSPEAPLESFAQALRRIRRPGTRILLRRGDAFPVGAGQVLSYFRGPLLVGSYGDPAEARPALNYAVGNTNQLLPTLALEDFRVSGLAIRQVNERRNAVFNTDPGMLGASGGTASNRDLLLHDLDCEPVGQLLTTSSSRRDRAIVIDRVRVEVGTNYGLYIEGIADFSLTRSVLDGEPINHFCRVNRFCRVQFAHLMRTQPHFIATTWVTLRGESCHFATVADSHGDLLSNAGEGSVIADQCGHNWTLVERNRVREVALAASSRSTARGNTLFYQHSNRSVGWASGDNPWFGTPEENRAYGNQFVNGVQVLGPGRIVTENNRTYSPPAALVPPAVALAQAPAPGLVVLSAYDHGVGGPGEPWLLRWMRKGPGEPEFSELAGQRGLAILDLPPTPGAYEYRLDLVPESGIAATGHVIDVDVPGESQATTYQLEAPSPSSGLAGESSAPFRVTLQGSPLPAGPITISPSSDGAGQFDPPQVVLSAEAPSGEFRFRPADAGAWQVSTTNGAGLADPPPVIYVASVLQNEPPGSIPPIEDPPVEPDPVDPPVEPDPVEPDPVEPDPVEPDPVDPPVEPDPVEPDPVDPPPGPEPEDPQDPGELSNPEQFTFDGQEEVTPPSSNPGKTIAAPAAKRDPRGATSPPPNAPDQVPGRPGAGPSQLNPGRPDERGRPPTPWFRNRGH